VYDLIKILPTVEAGKLTTSSGRSVQTGCVGMTHMPSPEGKWCINKLQHQLGESLNLHLKLSHTCDTVNLLNICRYDDQFSTNKKLNPQGQTLLKARWSLKVRWLLRNTTTK
jgi:hypothetical protein